MLCLTVNQAESGNRSVMSKIDDFTVSLIVSKHQIIFHLPKQLPETRKDKQVKRLWYNG